MRTNIPKLFRMEQKLYQEILFNIVVNAVKFNKQDGTIKLTLQILKDAGKTYLET